MTDADIDRALNAAFAAVFKDPRWLQWGQYDWSSIGASKSK